MYRLVISCVLVAACASDSTLDVVTVEDLGVLPLPPMGVGRDGGLSGALGDRVLWTFGDTFLSAPNHIDGASILSATAGWSTPAAPLDLAHAMDGDQPAQLIPYTDDEIAENTADALHGWALWPGALVPLDATTGLVAFQHVRRDTGGFASDGVGLARIHAGDPVATREPGLLFAAPELAFEPQVALDGYVYAWGCANVGFLDFRCKLARALVADVSERTAWRFYDGAAWQADVAKAAYVIDRAAGGPSISYNAHLGRYLAVNCEILSSTVLLRTADQIEGPWSDGVELQAGAAGILAPTHDGDYDYICVEHPELATADTITMSYSRPTDPFRGDVRVARLTLR
ncbi:MAG: DUF4185 domain-containing protein [Kofleriaceae bacterium]